VPGQDASSGNPYGSYVSSSADSYLPASPAGSYLPSSESYLPSTQAMPPDSTRPASGHDGRATGPGSDRASSRSQPTVGSEASAPLDRPSSGWYPDLAAPVPPTSAYLDASRQLPSLGIPAGGYLNGNGHAERAGYQAGQHDPSGYLPPSGYNGIPHDPGGYAGADPYGRDPYNQDPYGHDRHGYPGYGAADI